MGDSLTNEAAYGQRIRNCLAGDCAVVAPTGPTDYFVTQYAVGAYTLENMGTLLDATVADAFGDYTEQTIVLWGGTNDLYFGASAATTYTRFLARISAYQAAGYTRIVANTILPRSNGSTPPTFEADRQTVNTSIRNGAAAGGWVVADVGADPTIGEDGDEENTTYYPDLVHLTQAGYNVVGPIVAAAIGSL